MSDHLKREEGMVYFFLLCCHFPFPSAPASKESWLQSANGCEVFVTLMRQALDSVYMDLLKKRLNDNF